MKINSQSNLMFFLSMFLVGILLIVLVSAADPTWKEDAYNVSHYFNEDEVYIYNFTNNLTDYSQLSYFSVLDLLWSQNGSLTKHSDFPWLAWNDSSFSNSTTGIMPIDATLNNETGNFSINIHAQGSVTGQSTKFYFIINATNDAPNFTNINSTYNMTQDILFSEYINATDEEGHYSLFFNISFFNNCSLAAWSTREAGNCSLFNIVSSNDSASMNFTPTRNDAGVYWANVSVMDFGENYSCPHQYCDNATYEQNKTFYKVVEFNVFSSLEINSSDCQNKIFQENVSDTCLIEIYTRGETDTLNLSSFASIRNYAGLVSNTSWFFANSTGVASNFTRNVTINVTAFKTEVGNWTVNFSVQDITSGENLTEQIYVYVNRTYNDAPELMPINDLNTSISLETTINLYVYDDDLLIPDKSEGYNETTGFDIQILNQSDLGQLMNLSNFSVDILSMPVSLTNRTEARILFTPNASDVGDYTINISSNDSDGMISSQLFNMSIINNTAPRWDGLTTNVFVIYEDNNTYLNLSLNVSDSEGDNLVFSYTNTSAFPSFNLNSSTGVIDFTSVDYDVGEHIIEITIDDGFLTNTTTFNFTVLNLNDPPLVYDFYSNTPDSNYNLTHVIASETNYTVIYARIQDDDLRILSGQKSFYNESLSINTTVVNSSGDVVNWFNFSFLNFISGNIIIYDTNFMPTNSNVGEYNVSLNATDASNVSVVLNFTLIVLDTEVPPVLDSLINHTSKVNASFYYDFNSSDADEGNDTDGNLTYTWVFLSVNNFINSNETIFNSTSGILNITFNDSQAGVYHINLTVNDTTGLEDSGDFWIYVYDVPNIIFPALGNNFSLQENVTSNLTFRANHSAQDNLTYLFYINNNLRYNISYYGNASNLTWEFTPNFTDETFGNFTNLTLTVLNPIYSELNFSQVWNLNVTHANEPLTLSSNIVDYSGGSPQLVTLSDFFTDSDANDRNQTIGFSYNLLNSSGGAISVSIVNWTNATTPSISFSSSSDGSANYSVTGYEYNESNSSQVIRNVTSNNFSVDLTISVIVTTTPSTGGGGGGSTVRKIVLLKLIMPEPLSVYSKEQIVLPLTLSNEGEVDLKGIDLTGIVARNNILSDDLRVSFSEYYIDSLKAGEQKSLFMTVDIITDEIGTFEVTVNASVEDPKYTDWGKFYLTIKEGDTIREKLLFTEEFIVANPECIELTELVNEAFKSFDGGQVELAVKQADEAINACKNAISQPGKIRFREKIGRDIYLYLFVAVAVLFTFGVVFYFYRRIKLMRGMLINN